MENGLSPILVLGLLMVTGLTAGVLVSRLGLPRVTAYVSAGIIYSPALLGDYLAIDVTQWSEPVTTAALGIIAYLIGGSITVPQLRRMGKVILGSALGGALGATLVVIVAIFPFAPEIGETDPLLFTLALGAIASTTAPAATIAVLHQYRARGPLSSTLLGVVAVDDIIGIIIFSLMLVAATGASLTSSYEAALIEIFGSLLLGGILGLLLTIAGRHVRQGGLRLPIILAAIFIAMGFADYWHLSPLLTAMMLGFTARWRLGAAGDRLFAPVDYFEEMVFVVFFTIAGTHFDLHVFYSYFGLILIYFLARFVGKVAGAFTGASLAKAPREVRYWQGPALTPQAGVAVGLALTLMHQPGFEEIGGILINIIVASTILNEFFGPIAVRFALFKAGEIDIEAKRRKVKS
jgi:Kef-type K+ transport system membrane component KefB